MYIVSGFLSYLPERIERIFTYHTEQKTFYCRSLLNVLSSLLELERWTLR